MPEKVDISSQLSNQEVTFAQETSTQESEENEDDELYENATFQYDPDKINIFTKEPTIEQLLRRIDEDALDLAPDFQRQADIWKPDVKSRLIESILIRIPLPAFYIDATDEDKWLVVDGLQRLFALKQFISDQTLHLSGLEYLRNLNGQTYKQLDRRYQRRILETQVTVYLIEKGTPTEVKYNIFKRINTGGVPLSPQELRHALNPGKANKFLGKLASCQEFQLVTKLSATRKKRMDDCEFILGFLAFTLNSYQTYQEQERDTFLSNALSKANKLSEVELTQIENNFKRGMKACLEIFGENAFRKISNKQTKKYPINKALFEVLSVNLSQLDDREINILVDRKQELIEKFVTLVDNDREFLFSISQASSKVEYRFRTIETLIKEILA